MKPHKAYIDTVAAGLVPCVLIAHALDDVGNAAFTVRVTAKRPGYNPGDIITRRRSAIVPRGAVYRPRGSGVFWVRPYSWSEILGRD